MKLNKPSRRMLYWVAIGIKKQHPDWPNHSCLEDAFIKCDGFSNYTQPLESMLPEYRANPKADIETFLEKVTPKP